MTTFLFLSSVVFLSLTVTEEHLAVVDEDAIKAKEGRVTDMIDKDGGNLVYDDTLSIHIPPQTLSKPITVTLKATDKDEQLHKMASQMMLSPLLAIEISTSPKVLKFNNYITIYNYSYMHNVIYHLEELPFDHGIASTNFTWRFSLTESQ